jgi:hypothetical protein
MELSSTITANLMGGLGNQLFQISLAYSMAKKYNCKFVLDKEQFSGCRQGGHPNKYYDTIYKKIEFSPKSYNKRIEIEEKHWNYYDLSKQIEQMLNSTKLPIHINFKGYFQSENHFKKIKNEIKDLFTPQESIVTFLKNQYENVFHVFPELENEHDYCFIGVRRGDYITYAHFHNPCGMSYYNEAISMMKKTRYYISSDDIEWCKRNFIGDQFRFFDINNDLTQLYITSLFPNYIISNSTFYWWGSFLSTYDTPKIIAPDLWVGGTVAKMENYSSIYRDNMIILNRLVETI